MRPVLFLVMVVGALWAVDTFALDGRGTQVVQGAASFVSHQLRYEVWKIRFEYFS